MDEATGFHDVVIVGAGLAGLSAANYLIENGINDVIVLEAGSRVGGRVHSYLDTSSNSVFDLGAQWIHGSVDNALWDFCEERGLIEKEIKTYDGEGAFLLEGGKVIPPNLTSEVKNIVDSALESCSSFSRLSSDEVTAANVLEHLTREFQKYLSTCTEDVVEKKALFQWHVRYQVIDNACFCISDLCSRAWGEYSECEGEYCNTIKGGFQKIVEALLGKIPGRALRTGSKVLKVEQVKDSNLNGAVLVRTSAGDFVTNHVLYTPSIECLKKNLDCFVPSLDDRLLKSISSISMGTINKIFLIFENTFWDNDTRGFQLVLSETNGNEKEWYNDVTGFDVFPLHPHCLVAWVGGHGAVLTESLDEQTLITDCLKVLRKFLPDVQLPAVKKLHRTKWSSNEFALGAYSYRTAPFDPRLLDTLWIQDEKPLLLLAGEAYSYSHYATAHGAYESGMEQASKIVKWRSKHFVSKSCE